MQNNNNVPVMITKIRERMPIKHQSSRLNPGHKQLETLLPHSNRIPMHQTNVVQQKEINYIKQKEWLKDNRKTWTSRKLERSIIQHENKIYYYCSPVIHRVTG